MVDIIQTNPDAAPAAPTIDPNDPQAAAAIKAAEDAGVVVNGEQMEPADVTPQVTPRPDNVPEKFWDAEKGEVNTEALLKSYQDAEQKLSTKPTAETPAPEGEGEAPAETSPAQTGQASVEAAMAEYDANGEISPETYITLEKAGYSPEIVNAYIEGQAARQELENQKAYTAAGGTKETFDAMIGWARENLSKEEIASFNAQVTNAETSEYAVQQLYSRYTSEADIEPSLLAGDGGDTPSGVGIFNSSKEMQDAMSDKKYQTDESFRAMVAKKIAASERAGIRLFG